MTIAVAYLARGADAGHDAAFERFMRSYRRHRAGIDHVLYVLFKGFPDAARLESAKQIFSIVPHVPVSLGDTSFDIGAYGEWAADLREEVICPLNSASEILCDDWLLKLHANLQLPGVALAGATGSYESRHGTDADFPPFPNPHIRSTAFMARTDFFRGLMRGVTIRSKTDAYRFESGPDSLTRQAVGTGQSVLLVGRNGRGYSPAWWPASATFRFGPQDNLLVADNHTRAFAAMPWSKKQALIAETWGPYGNLHVRLPGAA